MAAVSTPTPARPIQWASDMQRDAFRYGPFPQCLAGGWGSGKTWVLSLKGIWLSTTYRRNRGVIARSVGKELRDTTMSTFYRVCPPHLYDRSQGGRRADQNGYLRFAASQSEILFLHLEDPSTQGIIRGLDINWFIIDQAEEDPEHMEEIFDLLCARLGRWDVAEVPVALIERELAAGRPWPYLHPESGLPVPPPYAMLACNPDVETHWIYRRFHPESTEHQTGYAAKGYKLFDMPSEANRFLSPTNLAFLLERDEAFVRRNVKGLWGMPEGAIHAIDALSLVPGDPQWLEYVRRHCLLFRTLDYGDSAPTCCVWWAVDRNGNVIAYREYYVPNALVSTHRANIAGLSEGERYEQDLADPSMFTQMPQRQGGRWSAADEYAEVQSQPRGTAIFWKPADNNEMGTRNRIGEYLRVDPGRVHPFTQQLGAPRVFFLQRNEAYPQGVYHVLRETRAQRRVKVGTDLGRPVFSDERDPEIVDHAYDCASLETEIVTREGLVSLGRMLGTTGEVLTVGGWRRYRDAQVYRRTSPFVRVRFSHGAVVTCTPDHLVWTGTAWTRADALWSGMRCVTLCGWERPSQWFRHVSRYGEGDAITCVDSIFSERGNAYTESCGGMSMGRFPLAIMSITAMATAPVTIPPIWSCSSGARISACTVDDRIMRDGWQRCGLGRDGGIGAERVGGGIERTRGTHWPRPGFVMLNGCATSVGGPSLRPEGVRVGRGSVGVHVASVMCVSVERVPDGPAACLTVDDPSHAFVVAGGVLLHNCLRYFIASRPPVPSPSPLPAQGTFEGARQQRREMLRRLGVR